MTRIAISKYKGTGRAKTFHGALNMLLTSILGEYKFKPWQEFRDDVLWSNEVDALYKANAVQLNKVYDKLFNVKSQQYEGLRNSIQLLTRDIDIGLTERNVKFCFGMSKMTIIDETNHLAEYNKLKYPEFLEFIGRLAHASLGDEVNVPLHQALPNFLD